MFYQSSPVHILLHAFINYNDICFLYLDYLWLSILKLLGQKKMSPTKINFHHILKLIRKCLKLNKKEIMNLDYPNDEYLSLPEI